MSYSSIPSSTSPRNATVLSPQEMHHEDDLSIDTPANAESLTVSHMSEKTTSKCMYVAAVVLIIGIAAIVFGITCALNASGVPQILLQQKAWVSLIAGGGTLTLLAAISMYRMNNPSGSVMDQNSTSSPNGMPPSKTPTRREAPLSQPPPAATANGRQPSAANKNNIARKLTGPQRSHCHMPHGPTAYAYISAGSSYPPRR